MPGMCALLCRALSRPVALMVAGSVLASALLVYLGSEAAFTAGSTSTTSFTGGSVTLTDDDNATALFTSAGLSPGVPRTACITVTFSGSLRSEVRLYATTGGTGLAAYLRVRVRRGTFQAPPGGGSCSGFDPDTADYAGKGAGVIFDGALSDLPSSFVTGVVDPSPGPGSPAPELWVPQERHAYEFRVEVADDNAAQGLQASSTFTWEARDSSGAAYAGKVLADRPVGYWRLGEPAGAVAADAVGTDAGTYTGSPLLGAQSGLAEGGDPAVTFDGVDDHVAFPYLLALNPSTFTVEAWARPTRVDRWSAVADAWYQPGSYRGYWLGVRDDGRWGAFVGNGTNAETAAVGPPAVAGTWVHVVATYDGSVLRLYVNGSLADSVAGPYLPVPSPVPFTIGALQPQSRDYFTGTLDEVALYATPLDPARVSVHYQAGR